jgi:hypothetical protein
MARGPRACAGPVGARHLVRPEVQQPDRRGVFGRRSSKRWPRCSAAAPDFRICSGTTHTAFITSAKRHVQIANIAERCNARTAMRTGRWSSRPPRRSPFAGAGVALFGGFARRTCAGGCAMRRCAASVPTSSTSCATCGCLRDAGPALEALMQRHRALLAPRFDRVLEVFRARLERYGIAQWTRPRGGYFITLDVLPGTRAARRRTRRPGRRHAHPGRARLFPAESIRRTSTLRIAPSSPSVDQVGRAAEVIALSVLLAATERLTTV